MSKARAHCNILQFLQASEPEFAKLVELTCFEDKLSAGHSKYGLTLLLPEAAAVKKLVAMAESGDRKQLRDACAHVATLILRNGFKSSKDFQASKDRILNSQYPSRQLELTKTDPVTLKSGAVLSPHPAFVDGSESENFAVWSLKGELPPVDGKVVDTKLAKVGKGKTGGYDQSHANELSKRMRNQIALIIEQTLVGGDDCGMRKAAVSLLNWVLTHSADESIKRAAAQRCCLHAADFYFLLEPHNESDFVIPDDQMIHDWYVSYTNRKCPEEPVDASFSKYCASEEEIKAIDAKRSELIKAIQSDYAGAVAALDSAYGDATRQARDELRFFIICKLQDNRAHPDKVALNTTLNQIAEMQNRCSKGDHNAGKLFKEEVVQISVEKLAYLQAFVKSTCFMFVPMACDAKVKRESACIVPPNKNGVWNVSKAGWDSHERVAEAVKAQLLAVAKSSSWTDAEKRAIIDALSK